jgi:hypothetical protein
MSLFRLGGHTEANRRWSAVVTFGRFDVPRVRATRQRNQSAQQCLSIVMSPPVISDRI